MPEKRPSRDGDSGPGGSAAPFPEPPRSLRNLVTPAEAKDLPVHRWFLYPHSFSPGLVGELLTTFHLPAGSVIYDPFAGAGTTIRMAQETGYSAFGTDMLPLSVLLSNAKVAHYRRPDLDRAWSRVNERFESQAMEDAIFESDIPLVTKAFHPEVATVLARIRRAVNGTQPPIFRRFFLVALARLLDDVSFAVKSGGWPRLVQREVPAIRVFPRFVEIVQTMLEDVGDSANNRQGKRWRCYRRDARLAPPVPQFNAVITSPPYLNRHDYTRVFALEHAVVFGVQQSGLVALRRELVHSHVEARRRRRPPGYVIPKELGDVLPVLQERVQSDQRVYPMLMGYFEDMFRSLRSLRLRLAPGGYVAFVLGDVRFTGVMLPVQAAVRRLGEQVGLEWCATWAARQRGNSAQQMKEYGREPADECVIIWRAPIAG